MHKANTGNSPFKNCLRASLRFLLFYNRQKTRTKQKQQEQTNTIVHLPINKQVTGEQLINGNGILFKNVITQRIDHDECYKNHIYQLKIKPKTQNSTKLPINRGNSSNAHVKYALQRTTTAAQRVVSRTGLNFVYVPKNVSV